MTEQQIAHDWRKAKDDNLRRGYATVWDQRAMRTIRQRQADGIAVSAAQVEFAERVEKIAGLR